MIISFLVLHCMLFKTLAQNSKRSSHIVDKTIRLGLSNDVSRLFLDRTLSSGRKMRIINTLKVVIIEQIIIAAARLDFEEFSKGCYHVIVPKMSLV